VVLSTSSLAEDSANAAAWPCSSCKPRGPASGCRYEVAGDPGLYTCDTIVYVPQHRSHHADDQRAAGEAVEVPQVQPDVPQQPFAAAQWVRWQPWQSVMRAVHKQSNLQGDSAAYLGMAHLWALRLNSVQTIFSIRSNNIQYSTRRWRTFTAMRSQMQQPALMRRSMAAAATLAAA
jgi:hypothetical protein